jgi:hypothetical protein
VVVAVAGSLGGGRLGNDDVMLHLKMTTNNLWWRGMESDTFLDPSSRAA